MTRPLALLCFACLALSAHAASAKPKVALTQIEGDDSGDVRTAVAEALDGKELSLLSAKEVNRAVDRIGEIGELKERDLKKLANDLEADAIVLGKLDPAGAQRKLKFRLYVHKKVVPGFTLTFKDARAEKFRDALHKKMIEKLGALGGDDAEAAEDERPVKKKKVAAAEDEEDPIAKPTKKDKKSKKAKAADAEAEPEAKPTKKAKLAEAEAEPEAKPTKKAKAAEAEAEPEARPAKKAKLAEAEADAEADAEARPAKKAKLSDGDAEGDAAKRGDDEDAPRKPKKKVAAEDGEELDSGVAATAEPTRAGSGPAIRLDVGPSVLAHSYKFNSKVFENQPKGPSLSPVPGVRLEVEVYPLALSNPSGPAAGLGIGVEYDKTLSAKLKTTAEPGVDVPLKESHYSVGVRYRLALGGGGTTLTLGVGYGKRMFSADISKLTMDAAKDAIRRDTPETNYTVIDPGLALHLPITKMFAFGVGGRGLVITSAGPIQNLTSYGRGKVYGFQGQASLDIALGARLGVRLAGDFTQIGFSFTGVGNLANGLDGDPATADVGGLADRSIGGSATLAVLY